MPRAASDIDDAYGISTHHTLAERSQRPSRARSEVHRALKLSENARPSHLGSLARRLLLQTAADPIEEDRPARGHWQAGLGGTHDETPSRPRPGRRLTHWR